MIRIINRKEVAILATISWMALIFYLSHQPASVSGELSGSLLAVIEQIVAYFPFPFDGETVHFYLRKSAHFFAYFILGVLVFHTVRLYIDIALRSITSAFLITVLYAISDEVHQTFIPGRSGEVRDVLIDSAGSFTGIIIYLLLILYNKKDPFMQK